MSVSRSSTSRIILPDSSSEASADDSEVIEIDAHESSLESEIKALARTPYMHASSDTVEYRRGVMDRMGRSAGSGEEQFNKLFDLLSKDLPPGVDRKEFERNLKQVLRTSLHEFVEKGSTAADKAIFAEFNKHVEQAIKKSPVIATWWEQAERNGITSLLGGLGGFALIATIMKTVSNYSDIGPNGAYLVILAGPWIAFVVEAIMGAAKGGGAGYVALDSAAFRGHDALKATIARKEKQLEGMRANAKPSQEAIDDAEEELASMKMKFRPIVVDLLRREFGHRLGLKREAEHGDVPVSSIFRCINSKLIVNEDQEVRIPGESERLFRVVRSSDTEVIVEWPDGGETDLLNGPIPADYQEAFETATALLIEAAKGRSRFTDDITFVIFGLPFLWNAAGPYLLAAGLPHAAVGDTMLMFASSLIGTFMLVFLQNAARSQLMGAPTGWASHPPVIEAKHNRAKVRAQVARVRLEELHRVRRKLVYEIKNADEHALQWESTYTAEQTQASRENLTRLRNLEADIKRACKQLVKSKGAAETEVRSTAGLPGLTWEGLRASAKANFWNNIPGGVGKVSYLLPYVIYSAFLIRMVLPALRPGGTPAPLPGNFTEEIFANATTVAAAAQDLSAWAPFMVVNSLGGFVMSLIFIPRITIALKVEYALHQVAGYAEKYLAMRKDNTQAAGKQMPRVPRGDPGRLVSSWRNNPRLLEQARANQILEVLVAIDADVLASGYGLEEELAKVVEELEWNDADVHRLSESIRSVLSSWDAWKDQFGDGADDMLDALNNVAWWCAAQDSPVLKPSLLLSAWLDAAKQMDLNSEYVGRLLQDIPENVLLKADLEETSKQADKVFEKNNWTARDLTDFDLVANYAVNNEDWKASWGDRQNDMQFVLLKLCLWANAKAQRIASE